MRPSLQIKGRKGKQCRERWQNQLDPTVKKGPWSEEEDEILIAAQKKHGNKWVDIAKVRALPSRLLASEIGTGRWRVCAQELEGRTDNSVKNHWNSHAMQVKLRALRGPEHVSDPVHQAKPRRAGSRSGGRRGGAGASKKRTARLNDEYPSPYPLFRTVSRL